MLEGESAIRPLKKAQADSTISDKACKMFEIIKDRFLDSIKGGKPTIHREVSLTTRNYKFRGIDSGHEFDYGEKIMKDEVESGRISVMGHISVAVSS